MNKYNSSRQSNKLQKAYSIYLKTLKLRALDEKIRALESLKNEH